jgi:hypothetical protein
VFCQGFSVNAHGLTHSARYVLRALCCSVGLSQCTKAASTTEQSELSQHKGVIVAPIFQIVATISQKGDPFSQKGDPFSKIGDPFFQKGDPFFRNEAKAPVTAASVPP